MMTNFIWYLDPLSPHQLYKKLSELDPSEKKLDLHMRDFVLQIVNSLN